MKVEVIQGICPAATGDYDFTGTTPASDMVGAIFFIDGCAANDTNTGSLRFGIGATDLTGNIALTIGAQDATAGAGIRPRMSNTNCLFCSNGTGANAAPTGAYSSTLTNGVRLTTSAVNANRITNCLLVSGSDVGMKVGSQYFNTGDLSKTITHGLGGTPDVLIILCSMDIASNTNETDGKGLSIGFWDRQSGNSSGWSYHATTGANPTDNAAYISNTSVGQILTASAVSANVTVSSVGSSTFNIVLSSVADSTQKFFGWIALRGVASQMYSRNILATMATSTGNLALMSGMSGQPQCFIALPSHMTTGNAIQNNDTANALGLAYGATNNFVATTQGANSGSFRYNVATSVARNAASNVNCLLVQDSTAGAFDLAATVNSWDSGGVTLNYSNAGASAFEVAVLAFGMPVGATQQPYPFARTQFFVQDTVTFG